MRIVGQPLPNIPWQDKPKGLAEPVWRYEKNPIIGWFPTPCSARIFNSAVLPYGDAFVGIFRSDHRNGTPQLHVGTSADGLHWDIADEWIHWVDEAGRPYETAYAYDPRLVELDGRYYVIWCTDMDGDPVLGLGYTTDFRRFVRLENPFFPFNRNGVLFPRRVKDKFLLLSRPSDSGHTPFGDIFVSESEDLTHWGRHRKVMSSGGGWWQETKIGAGPIPIETDEGWLLFYHGVVTTCNGYVYSVGAALLDRDNPCRVLRRTGDFLLTPQETYETTGFVPNVCFPCAVLCDADTGRIAIYYGAADTYTAVAFTTIQEISRFLEAHQELLPGDADEIR